MSLPKIGAVVKNVLISRSPDGDDLIEFEDGTVVTVRKPQKEEPVRMVRDKGEGAYMAKRGLTRMTREDWEDFERGAE